MQEKTLKERLHIPGPLYKLVEKVVGWSRKYSIWPVHFVTGCCSPEFMQVAGPRFDEERLGVLPIPGIRQADAIFIIGVISRKMARRVKYLYDQMGEPKYVISIGACPSGKGPFYDSYATVRADEVVPVDIYVPGCPPRPEAILHAIIMLQEKIQKEVEIGVREA